MKSPVMCPQLRPRLETYRIQGTNTAAILEGKNQAELSDEGTGDYDLTFTNPSQRVPTVVGLVSLTEDVDVRVAAISKTAISIAARTTGDETTGPAAADADFHLTLMMWDSADEI